MVRFLRSVINSGSKQIRKPSDHCQTLASGANLAASCFHMSFFLIFASCTLSYGNFFLTTAQYSVSSADLLKPTSLSNASSKTVQDSQKSHSVTPSCQLFVPIQQNIHSSSTSSPVSLTVSPSLKSPSFLAKSGTYSFRICPPSTQAGQQPSGVALPGGFTLVQLVNGEQPKPADVTSNSSAESQERVSNLSHLAREWVGFDTFSKVRTLLRRIEPKPDPSSGRLSEKIPSGGNGEKGELQQMDKQQELDSNMSSEELSSDFSDYDDCEEDVRPVVSVSKCLISYINLHLTTKICLSRMRWWTLKL